MLKPVKNYENEYLVSDTGEVFRKLKRSHRAIKQFPDKDGYFRVCLCKANKKRSVSVHRLVAEAFLENPQNLPCVNHIDENKQNNNVSNLEWCTVSYNNEYNNIHLRKGAKRRKPVIAIRNGKRLMFSCIAEASEKLKVSHGNISSCLYGKRKTTGGYTFEWGAKNG